MTSYRIAIDDATLADLRDRLARRRRPDAFAAQGSAYGVDPAFLDATLAYWRDGFDWRAAETALNAFTHVREEIGGIAVHALYARGRSADAVPLLMLHGWPSSFVQMLDLVPLLADRFHVVAASLPGYGFSGIPAAPGMHVGRIGELLTTLMVERLGFERFAGRGSDLGAGVLQQMALATPERFVGLHLSGTNPYVGAIPSDLSDEEKTFVADAQDWNAREMAYAMLHASKPQTVASALEDSPAGLAAWILEKFDRWTDHDGDLWSVLDRDRVLANLTIYWATSTINASMRLYYETARAALRWGRVEVPTAMLMSDRDFFPTPRSWVERSYRVERWTPLARGGHFLEWEQPHAVAADLHAFFAP